METGREPKINELYQMSNDVLFHRRHHQSTKWCVCIPTAFTEKLIWHTHLVWGHCGVQRCTDKIGRYCHVINLRKSVQNILRNCQICQKAKPSNHGARGVLHPIICEEPLKVVSIDVMGPLPRAKGNVNYIVGIYDLFTKYIKLYPIRTNSAAPIIKKIAHEYIPNVGKPSAMLSDNAACFTGKKWRRFLQDNNIKQILISRFHPEANPIERLFRELNRFIRTYCHHKQTMWVEYLKQFEEIYNNLSHTSTKYTPTELICDTQEDNEWINSLPRITGNEESREAKIRQAIINIKSMAQQRKKYFDSQLKRMHGFIIGQKILLRCHPKSSKLKKINRKWQLKYAGPFIVLGIPNPGAYLLAYPSSGKVKGVYPHQDLKPYFTKD